MEIMFELKIKNSTCPMPQVTISYWQMYYEDKLESGKKTVEDYYRVHFTHNFIN